MRREAAAPPALALALLVVGSLLAACGGGGGTGNVGPAPEPDGTVAMAVIGPAGGTVQITTGAHAGMALTVKAGAVANDTQFTIRVDRDEAAVPSVFPVYRFEPSDVVFPPDSVAVTVRGAPQLFGDLDQGLLTFTLFERPGAAGPFEVLPVTLLNELTRTVSGSPRQLGRFVAWNGELHRLFAQQLELLDPAVETTTETVFGVEVTVANGRDSLRLGRGSLASFWNSPASENVLILHGLSGSPLDFRGSFDWIRCLSPAVRNIVCVVYPSGLGVAANANALYDLIRANQQPGFGCTILGHSLGGNIGRYMVERSAEDPARAGFAAGDAPLSDVVRALFLVGTPNAGSNIGGELFTALAPVLPAADARFVRAGIDLLEGDDTFTAAQNAGYVDNPTVYHTICGDLGNGTDGLVSVASARAVPLFPPESEVVFPIGHFDLHRAAAWNGVADWINARLPVP
ncbi:MAG: hypothetical protein WBO45_20520 [Planctomycetota bacterium]